MLKSRVLIIVLAGFTALPFCSGCDSYAQKQQVMKDNWEKSTVSARVPMAAEMFANGRLDEAKQVLQRCLDVSPELAEGHLLMGRIRLAEGQFEQAVESFRRSVELDKAIDEGWYRMGTALEQLERPDEALHNYIEAMSLKPMNSEYIIAVAELQFERDEHDKALALLAKKERYVTDATAIRMTRAAFLQDLGRDDEAMSVYQQAVLADSDNAHVLSALGYCYVINGQWAEATEVFEKLLANSDASQRTVYLEMLAVCTMSDGRYSRATGYYDKLSISRRNDPVLWLRMGHATLGAGAVKRASYCAERALSLKPDWYEAVALKGCVQYFQADYSGAIKTFSRISSRKKTGGLAWFVTGKCYEKLGETQKASRAYDRAGQFDPESRLMTLIN